MFSKIKITISILLCFAISFSSFAAVSVSDGSAFVTKSEFSADFDNLDNRMALLENSLDAKIDSLVSSYLTRNGIWNGRKQELSTYTGLTNAITYNHLYNMYLSGRTKNFNQLVDGGTATKFTLVEKLDKAGLVHVRLNTTGTGIKMITVTAASGLDGYRFNGTSFTGHNYYRDGVRYTGGVNVYIYNKGEQVYQEEVINCNMQIEESASDTGLHYGASWNAKWVDKTLNAYFFAAKDDKVEWNMIYNAAYGEYWTAASGGLGNETIRGQVFKIKFQDVTVY